MKKLITILCLIISIASFGQSVVTRTTGTTTPNDVRLMASQNLFIPRFTDTTNANTNLGIDSCGAIFFSYSDNGIYYRACSPKHWLLIGSGVIVNDTIYVKTPLYVFIDSLGHRVIAIQRSNGLYSGGVVTQDSCFNLDASSANYSINFFSYTSANTILTVSTPDGSFPRIDLVYLDTTAQAKIRDGSATATPSPPSYNPVSEIALAYIYVPAGASCLGAITKTIYDGISDYPTQWGIALSGTFTTDTVNTDNPFHLNQAIFVSRYVDGSSITFTDAAADTITSTTVFKGHLYLNGALGSNNIQMQLFNTGTPVGNPITLLPYINPNDSNEYQLYQIRAGDFGVIAGNIFNQYKLTFSGNDLSGAKGLYLDYIQLQNGITNSNYNGHGVANFAMNATNDSVILTRDDGVTFTVPSGGGGGSQNWQQTLDVGSVLNKDNFPDGGGFDFGINNLGEGFLEADNGSSYSVVDVINKGATRYAALASSANSVSTTTTTFKVFDSSMKVESGFLGTHFIPLSVNGNFADATGNITVSGGGGNDTAIVTHTLAPDSSYSVDVHANRSIHLPNDTLRLIGSSTGGSTERFGIEDNLGIQDRSIDMGGYGFYMSNTNSYFELQSYNTTHSAYSDLSLIAGSFNLSGLDSTTGNTGSLQFATTELDPTNAGKMFFTINGNKIIIPAPASDIYSPLSVNGNFADATGNITVSGITLFTPANSTDSTYPNGSLTADDTYLYFRKSDGTWVKSLWVVF